MTIARKTSAKRKAPPAAELTHAICERLFEKDTKERTYSFSRSPRVSRTEKIYVDHTDLLCELASETEPCIICRPAGFGLGAVCDDLKALFGGQDFSGLKAEKRAKDFRADAVLRFDLSRMYRWRRDHLSFKRKFTGETFKKELSHYTEAVGETNAYYLEIEPEWQLTPSEVFCELCEVLDDEDNVLIIENVDAPLFYSRHNVRSMRVVERWLQDFFIPGLNNCREKFKFILLTARINFNPFRECGLPLKDLSHDPKYAVLAGFTSEDLKQYYAPELRLAAARRFRIHPDDIGQAELEQFEEFLNAELGGYRFAPGAEPLFWPREFCNYLRTGRAKSEKVWTGASAEDTQLAMFLGTDGSRVAQELLRQKQQSLLDGTLNNSGLFLDHDNLSLQPQEADTGIVNSFTLLQAAGCLTLSECVNQPGEAALYDIPNNCALARIKALTSSKR